MGLRAKEQSGYIPRGDAKEIGVRNGRYSIFHLGVKERK